MSKKKRTISELVKKRKKSSGSGGVDLIKEGNDLVINQSSVSKSSTNSGCSMDFDRSKNDVSLSDVPVVDPSGRDRSLADASFSDRLFFGESVRGPAGIDVPKKDRSRKDIPGLDVSVNGLSDNGGSVIDKSKMELSISDASSVDISITDESLSNTSDKDRLFDDASKINGSINDGSLGDPSGKDISLVDLSVKKSTNESYLDAIDELSKVRQQNNHFILDAEVIDQVLPKLKSMSAFAVYIYLWRMTIGQGKESINVSTKLIMNDVGLSRGAAQKAIELLNDQNLITSTGLKRGGIMPNHTILRPWKK